MSFEEELSALMRQAEDLEQMLTKAKCPDELRLPLLIVLLLRRCGVSSSDDHAPGDKPRIDEFFDEFKARNKGESVLGAVYYLYVVERRKEFTAADVQGVLRRARVSDIPVNIADVLNKQAQSKKWFIEVGVKNQQKLWSLSRDGENLAQARMEGETND